jgi:myo-inositol-1(or 4)-monophosphatase
MRLTIMSPAIEDLLETAVAAARAAGTHALENRHRRNEVDSSSAHDVKLRLDRECQSVIEAVIHDAFPGHAVFGEEGGTRDGGAEYLWVIDPIDGTVNFQHDARHWGPSVACLRGGETVAGAVFLPALDECYTATVDRPAQCNGQPIRVSDTPTLEKSIVLTGLSKHAGEEAALRVFRRLAQRAQKVRILGAAAADICMVAAGRADGYYETSLYEWDWAAAGLIARQAGARVEILEQHNELQARVMCATPRIADALRSALLDG